MYREPMCQNRRIEEYFIQVDNKRRQGKIDHAKKAIDNSWFTQTDPKGRRIKTAIPCFRKDGMNYRELLEAERQNKVLLGKISNIMVGKYQSSTRDEFRSSPKKIISKNEQRNRQEQQRIHQEN